MFIVRQTLTSPVRFTEAYPYDSVTMTDADLENETTPQLGFNTAADLTVPLGKRIGVGALVRFSRGRVTFSPSGSAVTADVGGLQAGIGVRFLF
jgi:hypothetical protein